MQNFTFFLHGNQFFLRFTILSVIYVLGLKQLMWYRKHSILLQVSEYHTENLFMVTIISVKLNSFRRRKSVLLKIPKKCLMPVGKLKRLTNITKLENRIASTTDLVKKTNYNTKIKEIEKDIPSATGFVKKKKNWLWFDWK